MLLQIALPLLLFSRDTSEPSTLTLKGGTNASLAPQIDYTEHVLFPFLRTHFGANVQLDVRRRGYFPKGGGELSVSVSPGGKLRSASVMERGAVRRIGGISHCAGVPASIARGMEQGARSRLKRSGFGDIGVVPVDIESRREKNDNTSGAGSGIVLWAELEGGGIIGGSALGKKGADAVKVGEEAAEELVKGLDAGGCVDEWLQDQIIIFMALAEGKSEVRCGKGGLSLHTK